MCASVRVCMRVFWGVCVGGVCMHVCVYLWGTCDLCVCVCVCVWRGLMNGAKAAPYRSEERVPVCCKTWIQRKLQRIHVDGSYLGGSNKDTIGC